MFERITARQLAVDAALALAVLVLGLNSSIEINAITDTFMREPDFFGFFLIAMMSVPLVLRRVFPLGVFLTVVAAWMLDRGFDYPSSLAVAGMVFAFHALGSELPPKRSLRWGAAGVVVVAGWTAVGVVFVPTVDWVNIIPMVLVTAAPLYLGREVYERRRRMELLEERAERAEGEREERARQAVAEERARIARELHDVVAHQMTVMTIQADGARRVVDADADRRVLAALDTIVDTGKSALSEMRRVVGLLRTVESDATLTPLPRLDDLEDLVEQVRGAGIPVTVNVSGDVRALDDGLELSAYRVIQEALTNAARHGGPGVSAAVEIQYDEDGLDLEIRDDGRGAAVPDENGGGHGLVGMRERVSVLGGSFEAGPRAGGGFRVHAMLPYES